jgi:sigma-B regulation protein RsbU (phosphoserine phosphatase)
MTRRWRPSITTLVALIVVIPILVVSLVLAGLSWFASARISEDLGQRVMADAARSSATEVRDYLAAAVRLSDRYARKIESGALPELPTLAWERPMLDDLLTTPSVASICYGDADGNATWLLRAPGRLEVGRAERGRENGAIEFVMDSAKAATVGQPLRVYTYEPRSRPWWALAVQSNSPRWTPVYAWFAGNSADTTIGTGYTRPIHRPDGRLRGVLVIDATLGALNDFLRRLDIAEQGRVFIVDGQGRLVAASHGKVTDDKGECYALASAPDPAARALGSAVSAEDLLADKTRNLKLWIDGAPARARITPLRPYPGIDWRVIAVLPESAFLAQAHAVRRDAIVAGGVATAASLILGTFLARQLARPVLSMTAHVKRVGAGDFDSRLDLHSARELTVLSDALNAMAAGLRQRMELEQSLAVAMEVQKSLLPAGDPVCARLDVAGRSKYCDQTGGDYYDFIDVSPLSASSLLVAVGDVMGHGIPAALVMATARAALRTTALRERGLGELLTRTNRVLAADNRHNRFMTLLLLRIDASSGVVKWASAGHDAAIVFDPLSQEFRQLEGGDVPLGLMPDVEYREYQSDALPTSAILIIGTDGVWEMANDQKQRYGKDRLRSIVRENHQRPAAHIAAALEADLAAFRGICNAEDDVTFVIIKLLS